jgi:integrase
MGPARVDPGPGPAAGSSARTGGRAAGHVARSADAGRRAARPLCGVPAGPAGAGGETVRGYCNTARAFLADRERPAGGLALEALDVAAIDEYLLRASQRGSVCSAKAAVTGLRSLLPFLHLDGLIDRDLAVAVPSVAKWRLASLVKALDADSLARLLDSCHRSTAVGRRDFAILMLLSPLGLRIGEVAALRLDHLDWRAGELVVCGKGGRQERLPLPVDVGAAIVEWLRDGRPDCLSRFLFTRVRAPHEGLHPASLNGVVHRACERAGLPRVGAHRLRHTAATQMLRGGSSLRDVGQVLPPPQQRGHLDLRQGRPPRAGCAGPAVAGGGGMSALGQHVDDYLAIRHALGFKLRSERRLLADFAAFMDSVGQPTVTIDAALRWATRPTGGRARLPGAADARVRGFARYLHGIDRRPRSRRSSCCRRAVTARRRTSTPSTRSGR